MGNLNLKNICGPEYNASSEMNTVKEDVSKVKEVRVNNTHRGSNTKMGEVVKKPNENVNKLMDTCYKMSNKLLLRYYSKKWLLTYMSYYLKSKNILIKMLNK
jgi:hypothetical protein